MLVHTKLGADSRVIKQARSMTARGWDVVILAAGAADHEVDIGSATVTVVRIRRLLRPQRAMYRTHWVRSPLAYNDPPTAQHHEAWQRARVGDLGYRADAIRAGQPTLAGLRLAALRVRRFGARVKLRWALARLHATEQLDVERLAMASKVDKFTTGFWTRSMGRRSWRRNWPGAYDQELAYGPVVDRLNPDIIHANDFMMLAVGARAKLRAHAAGRSVRLVWDAREYLAGMSPWSTHPRWKPGHLALEREFAPYADAVVTVSEPLGDLLMADYDLASRPAVLLNAPPILDPPVQSSTNVREVCGLTRDVPLIVYSGGAAPQRGLEIMIDALPLLPEAHTAFVVLPHESKVSPYVQSLAQRAADLGVQDRVHLLAYVPSDEVVSFLSTADVGVFPGLPFLNHTISLITKFLEYSHARLPIVVSDLKTMRETVTETGQGEWFEHGDSASYAVAIEKVLADRSSYVRAYDDEERMAGWTWERQAEVLDSVYDDLMRTGNA